MKLIFATNNQNKVKEIKSVVGDKYHVVSLREAGINVDIPEPYDTLEANAREKSKNIYKITQESCFSEDTGLEVAALNGNPGVKSSRYAGEEKSEKDNIIKLLSELNNHNNRAARFRTIISLIIENSEIQFEGICNGSIAMSCRGDRGFGYDPVFIPEGTTKTFGEMNTEEKNVYSHRRKAMDQLLDYLSKNGRK